VFGRNFLQYTERPVFLEQIGPNTGVRNDSGIGGCAARLRVERAHCGRLAPILAGTFWTILAVCISQKVPAKIGASG
jgi:hypothetical protein